MNREQAEKLLAALIFDDLDEASKAELLAYLQTDDELRDRLRDLQMTVKLTGDAVNEGPDPVLPERRLKQLQQLARTSKTTRRIFTIRPFVGVAAVLTLGLVLIGLLVPSLGGRRVVSRTGVAVNGTKPAARIRPLLRPPAMWTPQHAPAESDAPRADGQVSSVMQTEYTQTGATANADGDSGRAIVNGEGVRESAPAARPRYVGTPGGQAMTRGNRVARDEFSTQVPAQAGASVQMESSPRDSFGVNLGLKKDNEPVQVVVSGAPSVSQPENELRLHERSEGRTGARAATIGEEGKRIERELQVAKQIGNGPVETQPMPGLKSGEAPVMFGMGGDGGGTGRNGGMGGMGGYGGGMMGGMSSPTPPVGLQEEAKIRNLPMREPLPADASGTGSYNRQVQYGWSGTIIPEKPPVSVSTPTPSGPADASGKELGWAPDATSNGAVGRVVVPGDKLAAGRSVGGAVVPGSGPIVRQSGRGVYVQDAQSAADKDADTKLDATRDSRQLPILGDKPLVSSALTDVLHADEITYPTQPESNKRPGAEEPDAGLPSQSHFKTVPVNPWVMTERDPLSTFALDVDTASYALCRRYILNGFLPPVGAVRMEEFINAFDYAYPQRDEATFAVYAEGAPAPFAPAGQDLTLLKIAVKARAVGRDQRRAAHLVFVVDASASMGQADRLPPVQSALSLLVDKLSDADRVSLVTCAGDARLHLEAVPAREKDKIRRTIEAIQPAGSTNLAAGLKLGYSLARRAFVAGQINQVVLCSDGVANVGQTQAEALLQEVAADRKQGITITCVGVGYGAYNDALLEAMADSGDGRYVFLDPSPEARETLVGQLAATLQTVARDARIQVRFDPARVRRYRLIGYENRDIEDQRFRDDTVDAGEVGSGQCSTALYELELTDSSSREGNTDLGTVFVRYRNAESERIEEISRPLSGSIVRRRSVAQDPRFFLAAGAARFAEWLRQSEHAQHTSLVEIQRLLDEVSVALPLDRDVQDVAALAHRAEGLPRAP
jgi:Ca-activated chloride channel family protein